MDQHETMNMILEAIIFENWLRFNFIPADTDSDRPVLVISPENMEEIARLYPGLETLAAELANREIDFKASHKAIMNYIRKYIESGSEGLADKIMVSPEFQERVRNFQTWLQIHEKILDASCLEFRQWQRRFDKWSSSGAAVPCEISRKS